MTASEGLRSPVFDPVRDVSKEKVLLYMRKRRLEGQLAKTYKSSGITSARSIQLEVDASDAFDYEKLANAKYSIKEIKQMIIAEILGL